jgi:hypothetical protein
VCPLPTIFPILSLLQLLSLNRAVVVAEEEGEEDDLIPSLKVTWKAKKGDPSNGGYSTEILENIFSEVRKVKCNVSVV